MLCILAVVGCDSAETERAIREPTDTSPRAGTPQATPGPGTAADGSDPARGGAPPDAGARPDPERQGPRPEHVTDTILLEGMPEPIRLRLYRADPSGSIGFSTYVPEEMIVERVSTDDGVEIRFIAAFGGQRNDEAFMSLFFLPAGTSEREAADLTARVAGSRGLVPAVPGRDAWLAGSIAEYWAPQGCPGDEDCMRGRSALLRKGDRFVQVLLVYPIVYAEGLVPRANLIMENLRWADAG